jgi:hypothetical protein
VDGSEERTGRGGKSGELMPSRGTSRGVESTTDGKVIEQHPYSTTEETYPHVMSSRSAQAVNTAAALFRRPHGGGKSWDGGHGIGE